MITPDYNFLRKYFSKKKNIIITTHRSPDGDALGSSIALYDSLIEKGHNVHIIVPNSFPRFLEFLPHKEEIIIFESDVEKASNLIKKSDTFFF